MSKTEIYLVRHGECDGNRENRFRGRHDFPLNKNGIHQAESLAAELAAVRFDAIYSSPLLRASQTAEIIAGKRYSVRTDEAFINISLGEWENKSKEQVRREHPDLWEFWMTTPEKLQFPGMETLQQVKQRSYRRLLQLATEHTGNRILLVTHRAVLKPMLAAALQISEPYFWKLHMDTAAYSIAEYSSLRGFTLTQMNQNKHLADFIREDMG